MSKADFLSRPAPRQYIRFRLLPGSLRTNGRPCPPPWNHARDPMPCCTLRSLDSDIVTVRVQYCLN